MRALRMGLLALALFAGQGRAEALQPPTVVFLSDFGMRDDAVAICKGVMLDLVPGLRLVDLTHEVPPYSVRDGARLLGGTAPYWPAGTVFLAVVDPGVGSGRRAIVARTRRGQVFVLPDNGLLTLVADRDGLEEVREISNASWMRSPVSATFHGRDVFAPVAARVARGDDWHGIGPAVMSPVRIELPAATRDREGITGEVVATDGRYGNLVTNVGAAELTALGYRLGDRVPVIIGAHRLVLPYVRVFGDVPEGAPLLYVDSRERLSLAVNRGSFERTFDVAVPSRVVIPRKEASQRGEE